MLTRFIIAITMMSSAAMAQGIEHVSVLFQNNSAANIHIQTCLEQPNGNPVKEHWYTMLAGQQTIVRADDLCNNRILVSNAFQHAIHDWTIPQAHDPGSIKVSIEGSLFGQWRNQVWWIRGSARQSTILHQIGDNLEGYNHPSDNRRVLRMFSYTP